VDAALIATYRFDATTTRRRRDDDATTTRSPMSSMSADIRSSVIFQYRTEEDLCKKEEKKAKLLKETIPFYLNKFEQTVAENDGYAVGSTVSADIR